LNRLKTTTGTEVDEIPIRLSGNYPSMNEFYDEYMKLKALSHYSGISVRKLRDYVKDPDCPLPCFRMTGLILVKRSDFDRWMEENFKLKERDIDKIVYEVVNELF
jgi:hypothetical protein